MQSESDPNYLLSAINANNDTYISQSELSRDPLVMQIIVQRDLLNVSNIILAIEAMLPLFNTGAHYL